MPEPGTLRFCNWNCHAGCRTQRTGEPGQDISFLEHIAEVTA